MNTRKYANVNLHPLKLKPKFYYKPSMMSINAINNAISERHRIINKYLKEIEQFENIKSGIAKSMMTKKKEGAKGAKEEDKEIKTEEQKEIKEEVKNEESKTEEVKTEEKTEEPKTEEKKEVEQIIDNIIKEEEPKKQIKRPLKKDIKKKK